VPRQWSITDFVLVVLGGFLGAGVFFAVGSRFEESELILVLGLVGQYLGHLAVFWLLARRKHHPDIGFSIESRDALYIALGLLLQLVLAVLFFPLATLLLPEGDSAQQVSEVLSSLETTSAQIATVVVAVVLAPVVEEITFRGVLLRALSEWSRRAAMTFSALVFALFHLLGLDLTRFVEAAAIVLPQLFIVGLILAWVTLRSRRLGPAIFLHSGFNLLAALVLLIPPELLESLASG
jgi:uncharacterized protein